MDIATCAATEMAIDKHQAQADAQEVAKQTGKQIEISITLSSFGLLIDQYCRAYWFNSRISSHLASLSGIRIGFWINCWDVWN